MNCAPRCSAHLQRKNYFKFANRENLRIFPIDFFTGGVVKANGICSACFLRKQQRGRKAASPSPSAHYVRIHLSQGERPWQRDEVCVDCQGLPPRGSWHRAAMTERVQTEEVPLSIGIKPSRKDHTTSAAGARRSFPPAKSPGIVHLAQKKRNSTKQRK